MHVIEGGRQERTYTVQLHQCQVIQLSAHKAHTVTHCTYTLITHTRLIQLIIQLINVKT